MYKKGEQNGRHDGSEFNFSETAEKIARADKTKNDAEHEQREAREVTEKKLGINLTIDSIITLHKEIIFGYNKDIIHAEQKEEEFNELDMLRKCLKNGDYWETKIGKGGVTAEHYLESIKSFAERNIKSTADMTGINKKEKGDMLDKFNKLLEDCTIILDIIEKDPRKAIA